MGTDKKINVCHLISGDLWAGAEVQMFTLVAALKTSPEMNLSVMVLNEGKLATRLRDIDIETTVIDESKYGFYQILNRVKKKSADVKFDILHTQHYKLTCALGGLGAGSSRRGERAGRPEVDSLTRSEA